MSTATMTATRLPGVFDDYAIRLNCRLVGILLSPAPGIDERYCYAPNDGERVFFTDRSAALAHIGIGAAEAVAA